MPDEQLLLRTIISCAILSAIVAAGAALAALVVSRRRPDLQQALACVGAILGVAVAFYLGCRLLDLLPRWKMSEVDARFLYVLFPAVLATEIAAAFSKVPRWIAWIMRVGVAAAAPAILLRGSVYLLDASDPGTPAWTPVQAYGFLGGLSAALITLWALLAPLAYWVQDRVVPLAVAGTCAGAAVTVMLSGYLTGGEIGLPLAAALAGAALAVLILRGQGQVAGLLGVGIVGLFGVLALGLFFGELKILHALGLFAAPLLCWLPELPIVRRLRPWARGALRLVVVAIPIALVTLRAYHQFGEDSKRPAAPAEEPSMEDYLNFQP